MIGIERHGRFKELKRPYKISKRLNQTVSLVCYSGQSLTQQLVSDCSSNSDSIPESSIGWIRENKIIKNENKFQIVNSTLSDNGQYACYAANNIGMKKSQIRIRIH